MKKKLIAVLTAAVFIFAFAACGQEEQAEETTQATEVTEAAQEEPSEELQHTLIINSEPYCVTADSCDSRGYTYLIADSTDTFSFKAVNESDQEVSWKVYLMDKKFEDETRYIGESETPALEGDGTLDIAEGQYIYIYCSANEFEGDSGSVPSNAWLEINYAE